jgi:hypothetical protein
MFPVNPFSFWVFPVNPFSDRVKLNINAEKAVRIICELILLVLLSTVANPVQCGAGVARIAFSIPKKVGGAQKYDRSCIIDQLNIPILMNVMMPKIIGFIIKLRI